MPVVDLHTHSHCSDGSLSPCALVDAAHAAGVDLLALTDHDSISGNAEAAARARELGMGFWAGVELSVNWPRPAHPHKTAARPVVIHVVGLNLMPSAVLDGLIASQQQARHQRGRLMCAKLAHALGQDPWPAVLAAARHCPEAVTRTHLAQWLVQQGHVRTVQQAFDRWLGPGRPAQVAPAWCSMADALSAIHHAGGISVLAHPTRYGLSATLTRALIADFALHGGQALEWPDAQTPSGTRDMVARLCRQHGLRASTGSDYHGPHLHWRRLGRVPALPAEVAGVWRADVAGRCMPVQPSLF